MLKTKRSVTYRLYPSVKQEAALQSHLRLHCELYNACLQERREAFKRGVCLSEEMQVRQLPEIKKLRPELKVLGGHAFQETVRRVDLAFKAFFRRVKAGQTPGYPRFKSSSRYSGWTYKSLSNWRFRSDGKHGRIRMDGIGTVRIRGKARTVGKIKTCTITHKAGRWYASIVMECQPKRQAGSVDRGFDWGIESFLTLNDGSRVANPRFLDQAKQALCEAHQELSRKKRGSNNRRKAVRRLAALHRKVANRQNDFLHQVSSRLVESSSLLATEKLSLRNMSRSARGCVKEPGKNVRQKSGLNKRILDTAPGKFLSMLQYKAEEAGIELVEVNTRKAKPSQTCPYCGAVRKKLLSERIHICPCGARMSRDQASAQVCLNHALFGAGNRPSVVAVQAAYETATDLFSIGGR
ncbi:transposase [bacterium]|nr:transposase [bacterium]